MPLLRLRTACTPELRSTPFQELPHPRSILFTRAGERSHAMSMIARCNCRQRLERPARSGSLKERQATWGMSVSLLRSRNRNMLHRLQK